MRITVITHAIGDAWAHAWSRIIIRRTGSKKMDSKKDNRTDKKD